MTNSYEELISSFESKLQRLISEYESLKNQNASLQKELDRKQNELMYAHKEILEIQKNYDHLRMARYLNVSSKEQKISKQYINKLVREIDKCLALLDE
jgi:5'-deoxynucleotidase YfbR-like HD superfamily hydrolase